MMEEINVIVKLVRKNNCTVSMELCHVDSYFLNENLF